jgi:hypothetical protein
MGISPLINRADNRINIYCCYLALHNYAYREDDFLLQEYVSPL